MPSAPTAPDGGRAVLPPAIARHMHAPARLPDPRPPKGGSHPIPGMAAEGQPPQEAMAFLRAGFKGKAQGLLFRRDSIFRLGEAQPSGDSPEGILVAIAPRAEPFGVVAQYAPQGFDPAQGQAAIAHAHPASPFRGVSGRDEIPQQLPPFRAVGKPHALPWRPDIIEPPGAPGQQLVAKHKGVELMDQEMAVRLEPGIELRREHQAVVVANAPEGSIRESLRRQMAQEARRPESRGSHHHHGMGLQDRQALESPRPLRRGQRRTVHDQGHRHWQANAHEEASRMPGFRISTRGCSLNDPFNRSPFASRGISNPRGSTHSEKLSGRFAGADRTRSSYDRMP